MSKNFELIQSLRGGLDAALDSISAALEVSAPAKPAAGAADLPQLHPSVREELLKLIQRLFLSPGQPLPKIVTFAAIDPGKESSRLCAYTAHLLAQSVTGSVCLVEANPQASSSAELFAMHNRFGDEDPFRQEGPLLAFAKQTGRENLWLLPSGRRTADAAGLYTSDRAKERISELRGSFDYVLIDAPAFHFSADAVALGRQADGMVLILEANSTRREAALRVAQSLAAAGIKVLGAVLNQRTFPIPSVLYKRI